MDVAKDKLRCALREAVLSLCNNALDYSIELSIEGLIGVTLDKHDVFLVTLNEVVRSQEYEDLMAPPKSPQPQHDTQGSQSPGGRAPCGMSKRSYMKQLVKKRSAIRKAATFAKLKTWKMSEKLKVRLREEIIGRELVFINEMLPDNVGIPDSNATRKPLSAAMAAAILKGAPPKKRIRSSSFTEETHHDVLSGNMLCSDQIEKTESKETSSKQTNENWIPTGETRQNPSATKLTLPDPDSVQPDKADMIRIMNEVVGYNFERKKEMKKKRGEYNNYSSEIRLEIGQYAAEHGIPEALQYFKAKFGRPLSDSTVRSLRRVYMETLSKNKDAGNTRNIKELPKKERGRPLKLREYDRDVLDYIENIRSNGGMVSVQLVIDAARGVLLHKAKHKLKEFGGNVEITKGWADSFIRRMKQGGYLPHSKISSLPKEKELKKHFQDCTNDHHKSAESLANISRSNDIIQPHTSMSSNNGELNTSTVLRPPLNHINLTRYSQQNLEGGTQQQSLQNINPTSQTAAMHADTNSHMIHHEQNYMSESLPHDMNSVANNYLVSSAGFTEQLRGSALDHSASPDGYQDITELQQRNLTRRTIQQHAGSSYVDPLVHNRMGVLQGRNITHSEIDQSEPGGSTMYQPVDTAVFEHHPSMYGTS